MWEVSNPESPPHVLWSLFISCSINGSCAAVAAGGQSVRILGGEAWSDWTASELSKGEKEEEKKRRERWTLQLTVSRTAKVKGFYETLGFHSHRQVCVCVLLPNLPWSHNAAQERDLCRAHHGKVNKGSRKASLTTNQTLFVRANSHRYQLICTTVLAFEILWCARTSQTRWDAGRATSGMRRSRLLFCHFHKYS